MSNHLTSYLVNFYGGMVFLRKSEEKRFPKEQEVLTVESGEDTEEEDNVQAEEPLQRTAQGPVRVDVVTTKNPADRRLVKRRKVVDNSGVGQRPESRMAETQVTQLMMPKRRARPKKKANQSADGRSRTFESLEQGSDEDRSRTFGGEDGNTTCKSFTFGANAIYGKGRCTSTEDE
ncbi:hypothetical protein AXG93_1469s1010 [Marchantia polymorpha subsp. ruderalis]|uniref:Uncharacterized protein n=1 Tax=Marchantia polymorpha subsp. ruderalis TaxID=1480154 RepID=A0A176W9U3_MARPO|nr:hypothetical protein AXG93_1469s1010 [Marchantia polymorpha subsp. ruderalis]